MNFFKTMLGVLFFPQITIQENIIELQDREIARLKKELAPFSDEYFEGLTYEDIAKLAKKSLRLTKEHLTDLHTIEKLQEEIEYLRENTK